MATPSDEMNTKLTWRRFEDGNNKWDYFTDKIFNEDTSHKCPTYVHKTPPCQAACPNCGDIRGWIGIIAAIALYYGVQIFVVPEIQELTSALQNIRVH